ncbi:hypothetical protein HYH03_017807 [Edaphochlamys debaryana]|uniref:Large ribosomal subunit protein bL25 beta domain-containing protein n=1 Tax=Edaphochlamys debaryana TaxID=47281 RepID=A0A835XNG1_9CHLO|nr:hypothetical protein HYH03_017807 [Edaphochlamys debaryana]|eukprot:KAG2483304.1 hypothetical protein HYH03_017807 [Edaphochlamys debaryana]
MALAMAALRRGAGSGSGPLQAALRGCLAGITHQQSPGARELVAACSAEAPVCVRHQHVVARADPPSSVVPEAILKELKQMDTFLRSSSRVDGRHRSSLPLSAPSLPLPLPAHEVEPGLAALDAHVRPQMGARSSTLCKWLRRTGRVPGRVHSLPLGQAAEGGGGSRAAAESAAPGAQDGVMLLHFSEADVGKLVRSFGRNGCTARAVQVNVLPPSPSSSSSLVPASAATSVPSTSGASVVPAAPLGVLRAKPVRVHVNAVSGRVEALDLIYCPQDRVVVVDVPLRLVNDDVAPGVKRGGWMAVSKRTVRYKCLGSSIPPFVEVNVRHLDLDQDVIVRDLPIPPGTKIYEKDFNAVVLRCTTDVGKD